MPDMSDESDSQQRRRVIGIDLGGTKLAAGVVADDLVVHHRAHRFSRGADQTEILNRLVEVVDELRVQNQGEEPIQAVGMGIPSLIDQSTGRAVTTVNLPLADVPVRDLMSERLGLPVAIDNDANVAALVEQRFGAARGKRDVVLLTLGTGVGGGVVIDGKGFRGATGSGAELGHMTVLADGPPCQGGCPNRGCLETMCSGTAIARDAEVAARANPDSHLGRLLADGRELTGALVTELADGGDEQALAVLARAGFYLGTGIVSLVNIFNPEAVVIGGGAAAAGELMLGPARKVVRERALSPNKELCEVVPARFGAEAGMLGAAVLAFDDCLGGISAAERN